MKHEIPDDWQPSEKLKAWAIANGFGPTEYLEKHSEYFRDYCEASGAKYANFDAAFRNCLRGDWGNIRAKFVPVRRSEVVKRQEFVQTEEDREAAKAVLSQFIRRRAA